MFAAELRIRLNRRWTDAPGTVALAGDARRAIPGLGAVVRVGRFSAVGAALCGGEFGWVRSFLTVYAGAFARRDGRALCAREFSGWVLYIPLWCYFGCVLGGEPTFRAQSRLRGTRDVQFRGWGGGLGGQVQRLRRCAVRRRVEVGAVFFNGLRWRVRATRLGGAVRLGV